MKKPVSMLRNTTKSWITKFRASVKDKARRFRKEAPRFFWV